MDFLNDDWNVQGNTLESFESVLKDFSELTKIKKRNMDDFQFLNITDLGTGLAAFPLNTRNLWKKTKAALALKKYEADELLLTTRYGDAVTKESLANGLYVMFSQKKQSVAASAIFYKSGSYMPVSELAINTIASRVKLGGPNFSNPGIIRDLSIANYFDKPVPVYTVERKDPDLGCYKIFAIMSEKYININQKQILDIIKSVLELAEPDLGKGQCNYWSIDHSITRIYIDFPDCGSDFTSDYGLPDEMVPGLMVETSDIGDCSLRIKGYFSLGGNITYTEKEYKQVHLGELNMEEALDTINNHIFPEYRIYPEKLAKLMMIDLFEPTMTNAQKIKTMSSLYRDISRNIGLVKAIGKRREKALIEQLIISINPSLDYTAYDVAQIFLTLSGSIVTENRTIIDSVSRVVRNVLDYEFEENEEDELLVV